MHVLGYPYAQRDGECKTLQWGKSTLSVMLKIKKHTFFHVMFLWEYFPICPSIWTHILSFIQIFNPSTIHEDPQNHISSSSSNYHWDASNALKARLKQLILSLCRQITTQKMSLQPTTHTMETSTLNSNNSSGLSTLVNQEFISVPFHHVKLWLRETHAKNWRVFMLQQRERLPTNLEAHV